MRAVSKFTNRCNLVISVGFVTISSRYFHWIAGFIVMLWCVTLDFAQLRHVKPITKPLIKGSETYECNMER